MSTHCRVECVADQSGHRAPPRLRFWPSRHTPPPASSPFADALAPNIEVLPLTADIVNEAMSLPEFPNHDPADELIVATARLHKLTLLTTDRKLKKYRHVRIHYFTPIDTQSTAE